ncbi:hypothetical protein M406DRAFT_269792 [Cryphonectria parasitica EP155]|uniref:Uncharacterized protein n=1 Tax=Cryphonectria parasitica (strain ATCC 38755 / EP155) TaxID=660469 RepID=A0A9P4XSD1_CRYP1|nr:uncharacterized protein M406DRAFT_269792 [Cryphonectria parasitica EP155]KAF3759881.1 hypothetical protein M406DRAFT_269792 [Cryphonectria parasitica EP155]
MPTNTTTTTTTAAGPEPIAIVGSACRFPGGASSPAALWELLQRPRDVGTDIPEDRFDLRGFYHPDGSHHGTTNVRQAYLLQEDLRQFDSTFFGISPNEADSIDPQHRLLLETVYEALEAGGHRVESLRGSDTAVYTGTMSVDFLDSFTRDPDAMPRYLATGVNRAILSNRVSYFFDWHGPSMTIDTACSSSLVALHQGVHTLRLGESRVALACGTQVILNPEPFIMESKLSMLSPTGRSRMWDADADGYARGEGVAAVVMKRLSDAVADGDHIECIIRETGSNQDGHSNGITVPSTEAQASLIRQTYARAGLDPARRPQDRPQFFEAHGTGTKAGDPREAAAIHQVFGPPQDVVSRSSPLSTTASEPPLYVGSIKTVIGHLEGAAGLAGVLKASAMVQGGAVLPNLLFHRLNPDIEPYYRGLQVPTQLLPWPELPDGVPRRVSVNSFGFGGSNAHAIVEQYCNASDPGPPAESTSSPDPAHIPVTPFVFSALSEASLVAQLQAYSEHLGSRDEINPHDLAWTLQARRSEFATRAAFSAATTSQLKSKIDAKLAELSKTPGAVLGVRARPGAARPGVLGVFTGQGAQWPAMGAQLIRSSAFARGRVQDLEDALATLPPADRPAWRLSEEMLAQGNASRVSEAVMSQPLCTALQILLVDLLREAGLRFAAVVGHSSGEIAAAYAAGFLSARDAIRIAYYRGQIVQKAQHGAMLAVGTSWEDANDLVRLRAFRGRLAVAAHNSSASVTISGDADAVVHAKKIFDEEKKFARLLKVEKAYHSHHMLPCGDAYMDALRACAIGAEPHQHGGDPSCAWFSSVAPSSNPIRSTEGLQDIYWRDNLASSVLFAEAIQNAVTSDEDISLVVEIGPHPALKGPAMQTISDARSEPLPYCGTLSRGAGDIEALSDTLGFLWQHLGSRSIDFQSFSQAFSGSGSAKPHLVVGLPSYQWNHGRSHWSEPRRSRRIRSRKQAPHEILGTLSPDSNAHDMRWSNVLKASEISWLSGHKLQGQTVFPAAGYVAMALEASRALESAAAPVELFELHDLSIPKAIPFDEADSMGVETLVALTGVQHHQGAAATAHFSCYALPITTAGSDRDMDLIATGTVRVVFGTPSADALSPPPQEDHSMFPADADRFYSSLADLGYGYSGPFRALRDIKRKLNHATALIDSYPYTDADLSTYLVHPSTLDTAFQLAMAACSAPGDGQLWSLHVPTSIQSIRVNPAVCASMPLAGVPVPARTAVDAAPQSFTASIDLLSDDRQSVMVRIEDLVIKPFAPATKADDRVTFTFTKFDLAAPDGSLVVEGVRPSADEVETFSACERIAYYYHRKWRSEITDAEWANGPPHQLLLRDWVNHTVSRVSAGQHPALKKEWSEDSAEDIKALARRHWEHVVIRIITAVGENMAAAVRGETTILEHMTADNMLTEYYEKGAGISTYHSFLGSMVRQLAHRYPRAKFIEIGAGTGGATGPVLEAAGSTMSSYTYTDISPAFFEQAAKSFATYSDKMAYRVLDIEKAPAAQGYEPHSYDIVIAFNVLHATHSLQATLANTRQLLRPGGYLILMEFTNNDAIRVGTTMAGLPGWWLGADDGRVFSPTVTTREWHSALRKSGFGGVDTATPEIDGITWPLSIIVAQAVDDRVQFLRRPLSSPSLAPARIESLVILGTGTLVSSRIAEELAELLEGFCDEVTVLDSLPTREEALALSPLSTFINLADLDTPIFRDMTKDKMECLQRMFDLAKHVLWVTHGAVVDQPYHMASIVFSRTVRREELHISLNHLDVSDPGRPDTSKAIAEHFLQLYALDEWEADRQLLWSKEPEAFLDAGQLKLPRLVPDPGQNARVNASRRTVTKTLPASSPSTNAEIVQSPTGSPPDVMEVVVPPGRVQGAEGHGPLAGVHSSSLMALGVAPDTFLFLAARTADDGSGAYILSLSATNSYRTAPVASFTVPVDARSKETSTDGLVVATAAELIVDSMLQNVSQGARILLNCSPQDAVLISALRCRAASKDVHLILTCDVGAAAEDAHSRDVTLLDPGARASQYHMRRALHVVRPTLYVDLALLGLEIARALPAGCRTVDAAAFFQRQSSLPKLLDGPALSQQLEAATARSLAAVASWRALPPGLVVSLHQIRDISTPHHATTAVCWPRDGLLEAHVRPLDARALFSPNKTYLLVGLSGQIGQSLCEFMVSNGAGCVCLTSRRPHVDERWLASVRTSGAEVKVLAMDVTDRSSAESVVSQIRASCPPIAGVAHGANILSDALFSRTTIDEMTRTLRPKIDGANNLDDIFRDDDLDFFVLFSSVSSLAGNIGQSAYVAGNGYLNGLARQRRKRGLAASAFDIGRVVGLGVIETVEQHVVDQLLALGLPPLGEADLQQAFAETILMGYPNPEDQRGVPHAVVTTTVRRFSDDEDGEVKGPWFSSPLFSHLITESAGIGLGRQSDEQGQASASALRISEQLSRATSMEQAGAVLRECFSAKLRVILQILDEEALDPSVPVVELGIDSLVAVEVRSWFLKELKVDVPVLKVVGGASIAELCEGVLEKLPREALSSLGKEEVKPSAAPAVKAAPAPLLPPPAGELSSASDRDSTQGAGSESLHHAPIPSRTSIATTPSPSRSVSPPTAELSAKSRRFLKTVPISFAQSRYWFLHQLLQDPRTSNVAACYHVQGNLRIADLERATRIVLARHEALRTCFVQDDADAAHAYQSILPRSPIQLRCEKASSIDEVNARFARLREHNFDLASGELLQMVLITLSPSSHYLLVHHHHIIMDGVSVQVFLADLEKAYSGQPLGPAPRQYPEFSVTQRQQFSEGTMAQELQYWRAVFPAGEQPPVLPLLPMARTRSRTVMKQFDTHEVQCTLEPDVAALIRLAAKKQASTPFHFYLAVFEAMLFRLTDAQELIIGMADAARNTGDTQNSIGFFLNLLALRFRRQLDQRFTEAINNARKTSHAALKSSRLPFDVLLTELGIARSSSHSPLFQAFIDYRQGSQEGKQPWANCQLVMLESTLGKTAYDVTLDVTDNPGSHALVTMRVQKSLYDTAAADLLLETYVHLLHAFASDQSVPSGTPPLFSQNMLTRAVEVGRGPVLVSDWPETLPHRIDQIAQQYPDRIALIDGLGAAPLTYSSMLSRIEAIAEALQEVQVGPGARVLVLQQAAADWVCSMLAIMRVGAVYVPMDLRNPATRLAAVAADCMPAAILADATTASDAPRLNAPQATIINISTVPSSPAGERRVTKNCASAAAPAAILYTSGSTGTPKGIVVSHAGLRNEIEGYTKTWKLGAERVLQQSAFTFDFASDELYTGLVNGGLVYIVPGSARSSPLDITEIIWKQGITYTRATPSEYLLWLQYGGENLRRASEWRFAFAGGETLTTTVAQELAALNNPQLRFFNSYGPAETSISSCKIEVDYRREASLARIPCGYSLPNYQTYIVDEKLQPQPVGMPGEICISGAGVSLGYLNNEPLSNRHFIPNPFATAEDLAQGWTRMYRTGDIGHLEADGALVFHRRVDGDTQVKIRGIRVDLADIESNIIAAGKGALREAVVTLREGDLLVAYVVFAPGQHTASDQSEAFLDRLLSQLPLPQYMVPVVAFPVDRLPLTSHAKVDRKAVQNMPLLHRKTKATNRHDDSSLTETMAQLKDIWQDVIGPRIHELGLDIGPLTNFFFVGGNSLLVIRLQSRIQQVFHIAVPLVKLLGANTLAEMAATIEEAVSVTLTIDWDKETALPRLPAFLADISASPLDYQQHAKTVLVTGGTGFLARHLVPMLAASPDISTIHCLAVREERPDRPRSLPDSNKITWHRGDLTMPLLGLEQDMFRSLAAQADVIVHLGAARSIWDSYHTLRASNVHPTQELVKLAAPRRIPIYFISTIAAAANSAATASIAAPSPTPSTDGADGYVATKWASERILARAADTLGIPCTVYRFLPASKPKPAPKRLMDELARFVDVLGCVPDPSGWAGRLYMIPADEVAQRLCAAVASGSNKERGAKAEQYQCDVTLTGDEIITHLCKQSGNESREQIPMLKWFGRIKKLGFDYFIASHEATVGGSVGEGGLGSRR